MTEPVKRRPGRPKMPADQKKQQLNVVVPPDIKQQIEAEADSRGVSMAAVVCEVLSRVYRPVLQIAPTKARGGAATKEEERNDGLEELD